MNFSDALSLTGLVLVIAMLLCAARSGPMQPVYERMTLQAPAPLAVQPVLPENTRNAADAQAPAATSETTAWRRGSH